MTSERLAGIGRWYVRAGLFVLPLAYSWQTYDPYIVPKLLVARLLVVGLLFLFIARAFIARSLVVKRTPLDWPLLAFLASAVVSTLFAENQNVAVFGIYSRYDGLLTILTYAALFWLVVQTLEAPGDARKLLWVLLAGGYVVAAIAIVQSVTDSLRLGVFVPASGTLGQKNVLGAFLALICPVAYGELAAARSWGARLLAANALTVYGLALFLSFSRSAWVAVALSAVVVAVGVRGPGLRIATGAVAGIVLLAAAIALLAQAGGLQPQRADLGEFGDRPAVYQDSLHLVASRPLTGYGPDNFGLVFPRFESTDLHQQWDKAHAETLQIAATQGVLGLAAYLFILVAFVRAFWRGRHNPGAFAVFAGWVGYTATLQVNFSALASAFPFWIFAAAALEIWGSVRTAQVGPWRDGRRLARGGSVVAAGATIVIAVASFLPYLADARVLAAVNADFAGRNRDALAPAEEATRLWPRESVYEVEVGNVAFERQDWVLARDAYVEAASLGTYNPLVYRNLAIADRNLGRIAEGREAARKAVELNSFDTVNRALLAQFEAAQP